MSLTAQLASEMPVRRYLDRRFGAYLRGAKRRLPAATREGLAQLAISSPEGLSGGALGTIGTAFDYRARYYFEAVAAEPLTAHRGAAYLCGRCDARLAVGEVRRLEVARSLAIAMPSRQGPSRQLIDGFFDDLNEVVARLSPVHRRLECEEERVLARSTVWRPPGAASWPEETPHHG